MLWNQAKTRPVLGGKNYKFNILFFPSWLPLFFQRQSIFSKKFAVGKERFIKYRDDWTSWRQIHCYSFEWRVLMPLWSARASWANTAWTSFVRALYKCPRSFERRTRASSATLYWRHRGTEKMHAMIFLTWVMSFYNIIFFLQQRILLEYPEKVRRFGLSLERDLSSECLRANLVPACFLQRQASENFFKRPSQLQSLVSELALELVQTLIDTKGAICVLPRAILNVINSQACRGTIFQRFYCSQP